MFTGMMFKSPITEIEYCKYSLDAKVVFDSPYW
jgi:hypothetical protein